MNTIDKNSSYTVNIGRIPVIIHVPHASTFFPKQKLEKNVLLNKENNLSEDIEIIADRHIDIVFSRIFKDSNLKPYWFKSELSRMFMDPERFNDPHEEMNKVGMGIVYTKNHRGKEIYNNPPSEEQVQERIKNYYDPYAQAFSDTVDHILYRYGKCLIIDAHSYATKALPYELHSSEERAPLIIGYDDFHISEITTPLSAICSQSYVAKNTVFKGSYVPLKHLEKNPLVSSVMFELRKDTYLDEQSGVLKRTEHSPYLESMSNNVLDLIQDYLNV